MCIGEVIRNERVRYDISQAELSRRLNISQSIISDIENEKRSIPTDIITKIPDALNGSAKLKAEIAYETGAEFFKVPILNNVDDNLKNVLDVFVEEAIEAIRNAQEIKKVLRNSKPGSDIEIERTDEILKCMEQIGDLYAALKMLFIAADEGYGVKVRDVETRVRKKLKQKNYY